MFFPSAAYPRFEEADADAIDQEENLSTGTFGDELSYRYPMAWERLWRRTAVGFRASAGSYNKRDLLYRHSLKLSSPAARPVVFTFAEERQDDLIGSYAERAFKLRFNAGRSQFFSLLIDTDGAKEYGDGGVSVGVQPRSDRKLELSYWSVDHYYNGKKQYGADRMTRSSKTYEVKYDWAFSPFWSASYLAMVDTPLAWHRPSAGYDYTYERWRQSWLLEFGNFSQGRFVQGRADLESKREGKNFLGDDRAKALRRDVETYEILGNYGEPGQYDLTAGMIFNHRDATYKWQGDEPASAYEEGPSPSSERHEFAPYVTYGKTVADDWLVQYGLFTNSVHRRAAGRASLYTEVKAQLAWNYQITTSAGLLINTTWDIDQIAGAFPYTEESFQPWDGGNIQFIAVF